MNWLLVIVAVAADPLYELNEAQMNLVHRPHERNAANATFALNPGA